MCRQDRVIQVAASRANIISLKDKAKTMQTLMDKARDLVNCAEGQLLEKEAIILALRRELVKVRGELAAIKDPRLAVRSPRCEGCAYRVIALEALEKEEKVQEKWSVK